MNEKFTQYRGKLAQYWNSMGRNQKIWLGATLGILLLSVILLTTFFSRTQYEVAFQDLDSTDSAAVMNYLDTNKIAYKLDDAGKTISVPSANAAKVKVEAGSQGLVQNGSIGFEAFNDGGSMFGSTDREFDVKYRNALNGEIQRLLNNMQGVQKSSVLVNLPEKSVFVSTEEKEQASASIMMDFKPGYRPSQKEVDGYYNLVKTAVPNLSIDNITISSPEGELLASTALGGSNGGSALALETHYQIQHKYEADLKRNIQQFLGRMVGMDNLVVNVQSSINFDKKKSDQQLVEPLPDNSNNGIIISEQTDNKSTTGAGAAGGVAGTGETDVPGYQATEGSGAGTSEENSRTTNYEVNRINNQIESGPYVIKDLSISVGVDKTRLDDETKAGMNEFLVSLVRSQLVESGQDVNDDLLITKKVAILGQTFADGSSSSSATGLSTGWLVGIGLAALAIIGGLVYVVLRRRKQAAMEQEDDMVVPGKVEYPTIDLDAVNNESQVRKQLETLAKRKPEEFVNLLRTWLVDE
ncbi:flagellar basal-body MS-ring/collar protein FliF [Paenibacillus nasutitermitis]|uniref:Flagellar M-ring protein n=1 Tax=Paenibacillus nasutitermitis TaxID=1652958 RepID=A0A917DTC0_9BACL|nr:flagellar basal-body MS-ring/collar protein FliF [Paenibacillus nasutitermitis]GGD68404.1 flagellar M-ring protein [Paenibacillus nasutitermitis]